MDYKGTIIEESLKDKKVLDKVRILKTEVEKVTEQHHTPNLKRWTLHLVEISEGNADDVARDLSMSIDDSKRNGNWYADFKNDSIHYIVFPGRVFKVDRNRKKEYDEARKYGISLGIPEHQLDFSKNVVV